MNINLHIDSIVLDGIDLATGDDRLIHQSVSRELTTLLSRETLPTFHLNSVNADSLSGGTIRFGSTGATSLGPQLARRIHQQFQVAASPFAEKCGGQK